MYMYLSMFYCECTADGDVSYVATEKAAIHHQQKEEDHLATASQKAQLQVLRVFLSTSFEVIRLYDECFNTIILCLF